MPTVGILRSQGEVGMPVVLISKAIILYVHVLARNWDLLLCFIVPPCCHSNPLLPGVRLQFSGKPTATCDRSRSL